MTAFEIIILVILYMAMVGYVLRNYQYSTGDESVRIGLVIASILLAWLAPVIFAAYIHRCIVKFLDN